MVGLIIGRGGIEIETQDFAVVCGKAARELHVRRAVERHVDFPIRANPQCAACAIWRCRRAIEQYGAFPERVAHLTEARDDELVAITRTRRRIKRVQQPAFVELRIDRQRQQTTSRQLNVR